MSQSKYLRYSDMCKRYGVSRYTIMRWVQIGRLPMPDTSMGTRPRWCRNVLDRIDGRIEDAQAEALQ